MKYTINRTGLSIVPVFEEVLSKTKAGALPVIAWSDERNQGAARKQNSVHERNFAAALEVACEHIHTLEVQLFALAKVARANVR